MILVTGGSGFVGKEIVKRLLSSGLRVRVLARTTRISTHPSLEYFSADISKPETLRGCCKNVRCIIHLVGVLFPSKDNTYQSAHIDATRNILEEARRSGISRYLHMSAIGTRANASSTYHQTKWAAEELVRNSGLDWTIFRPSLIYGRSDPFVGLFDHMLTFPRNIFNAFTLPCLGEGKTIFKPLAVDEVADCFVRSIGMPGANLKTIDLIGHPITFRAILEEIARAKGLHPTSLEGSLLTLPFKVPASILFHSHPVIFPISIALAKALLGIRVHIPDCEWLLGPPIVPDVLKMLEENQAGDPTLAQELFDLHPRPFYEGISKFIKP